MQGVTIMSSNNGEFIPIETILRENTAFVKEEPIEMLHLRAIERLRALVSHPACPASFKQKLLEEIPEIEEQLKGR
jgi:hypothetical protein